MKFRTLPNNVSDSWIKIQIGFAMSKSVETNSKFSQSEENINSNEKHESD